MPRIVTGWVGHWYGPRNRQRKAPSTNSSLLTAEEYRIKYLLNGNASHARLMRFARMLKKERNNA